MRMFNIIPVLQQDTKSIIAYHEIVMPFSFLGLSTYISVYQLPEAPISLLYLIG